MEKFYGTKNWIANKVLVKLVPHAILDDGVCHSILRTRWLFDSTRHLSGCWALESDDRTIKIVGWWWRTNMCQSKWLRSICGPWSMILRGCRRIIPARARIANYRDSKKYIFLRQKSIDYIEWSKNHKGSILKFVIFTEIKNILYLLTTHLVTSDMVCLNFNQVPKWFRLPLPLFLIKFTPGQDEFPGNGISGTGNVS